VKKSKYKVDKNKVELMLVDEISDEVDLNRDRSRYTIEEQPRGFVISSPGRVTTYVTLQDDHQFLITKIKDLNQKEKDIGTRVGPYSFRSLLSNIVNILMSEYKRPSKKIPEKLRTRANQDYIPPTLKKWLHKKVQIALNHKIHEQWARLITLIPANVNQLAKSMFRSTLSFSEHATNPIIYEKYPYLVKDLNKYFSANVMFAYGSEHYLRMSPEMFERYGGIPDKNGKLHPMYYVDKNSVHIGRYNVETQYSDYVNLSPDDYFSLMSDWRILYSYNQKPYRALDVTLDNATNISGRFLAKLLPFIYLERPIYERLELTALIAAYEKLHNMGIAHDLPHLPYAETGNNRRNHRDDVENKIHNANLFQHATVAQIKTLMDRVGTHMVHSPYNHRKIVQVMAAVSFALDYPEKHHGNIVGLADKAIDWHRGLQARLEENRRKGSDPETPNALPPIPLPEDEHITFLAKVGDLFNESDLMKHCVYSYSFQTIRGHSFIFHIEKDGDIATVEINRNGELIQAHGIHNRSASAVNPKKTNAAILYGRKVLSAWGKKFAEYDHESHKLEAEMGVRIAPDLPDDDPFAIGFGRILEDDEDYIPF
jgi:hypothetical protein